MPDATPGCSLKLDVGGFSDKPYRVYFCRVDSAAVEGAINMAKVANENIDNYT